MISLNIGIQIDLAIHRGFRRFNMYDLSKNGFSVELNGNHLNIILVERYGGHVSDVCLLSDLYFSEQCDFLRILLGKGRYLEIAKELLPLSDVDRVAHVQEAVEGEEQS